MEILNKRELQSVALKHLSDINFTDFMKLYTKVPYSFFVNNVNIMIQEALIIKMSVSEKIKTIDNKIKQNKAQYNLDRKNAKISTLTSGNVSTYKF